MWPSELLQLGMQGQGPGWSPQVRSMRLSFSLLVILLVHRLECEVWREAGERPERDEVRVMIRSVLSRIVISDLFSFENAPNTEN